jgi:hypothetical protein
VEGGVASPWPKPVEPKQGAINGPTQPMYWAQAEGNNMVVEKNPSMRPQYNSKWGWSDGAQTGAFGGTNEVPAGGGTGGKTSQVLTGAVARPTSAQPAVASVAQPPPPVIPVNSRGGVPPSLPATSTSDCRRSRQTGHGQKRYLRKCDQPGG